MQAAPRLFQAGQQLLERQHYVGLQVRHVEQVRVELVQQVIDQRLLANAAGASQHHQTGPIAQQVLQLFNNFRTTGAGEERRALRRVGERVPFHWHVVVHAGYVLLHH